MDCLMAATASSFGSTPEMAKKQVCMMVFMRPPMPVFCATALPSMTYSFAFFSRIWRCTASGRLSHTRSAGNGELMSTVPPVTSGVSMSIFSRNGHWCTATKFACVMRYVERMGRGPKRRCDVVVEPDFFESYTK